MGFKYQVGDLNLVSDIQLPTLKSKDFDNHDLEVVVTSKLQTPNKTIEFLHDGSVLYQDIFGNIFLINKSKIIVSIKENNIDDASISILGIPLGYLLQNDKFQVLHGSSVAQNGSAICFIGRSGIGKSSLAMSLVDKGLKLVTEDLCLIKNSSVYNFSDWVKSDENNLIETLKPIERINLKKDSRQRSLYKLKKGYVSKNKTKLKAIYFIIDSNKKRSIKKVSPLDSFKYLFTYAYRKSDRDALSLEKLTKLSEQVDCYIYSRDIKKPIEDNSRFIFDHIMESL